MVDQDLIDLLVVLSTILYNTLLTAVFVLRAYDNEKWEKRMGLPFNLLLIPFILLWILTLLNGFDFGRLGMTISWS